MSALGSTRSLRRCRCMTALAPKAEVNPRSCYVGEVPNAHDRRAAKVGCKRASAYGEMPSPNAAGATKTHCPTRGLRRVRDLFQRQHVAAGPEAGFERGRILFG